MRRRERARRTVAAPPGGVARVRPQRAALDRADQTGTPAAHRHAGSVRRLRRSDRYRRARGGNARDRVRAASSARAVFGRLRRDAAAAVHSRTLRAGAGALSKRLRSRSREHRGTDGIAALYAGAARTARVARRRARATDAQRRAGHVPTGDGGANRRSPDARGGLRARLGGGSRDRPREAGRAANRRGRNDGRSRARRERRLLRASHAR